MSAKLSDPEIYGWRGDDPFLSRLNAEKVEIARKSGSNMYVHLKDYERLTRENAELLKATGVIEAGLRHEIERLTRTTVNQRNELARLTFDNNHNFKATTKLQIEIERTAKLQIEIERLTRELEHEVSISRRANNRLVDLDTEIERLRAALERAARWNEHFEYAFSQDIMEFAREALQEPK